MNFKEIIRKIKEKISARPLFYLLFITITMRLIYLLFDYPLWWDSHIYLAMGKFFFSQGQLGAFESFRPPLWPLLLGIIWKLNFSQIIFGKILDLIFSTLSVYLTYLIGKKLFSEKIALLGALIFSFNPIFLMHVGLILTEPLAIFLGLWGIFFFLQFLETEKFWRLFLSGIFLGLSFLSKFPQGIFFAAVLIIIFFNRSSWKQKIKSSFWLSLGFSLIIIPDLLFNYLYLHSILGPFLWGNEIVGTATWLYGSGLKYYFSHFFFNNPLTVFFFPALYFFFKEKLWENKSKLLFVIIPILTIIYFLYVPRKEPRYLVTILPFITLFSAEIILRTYSWLKSKTLPLLREKSFLVLCFLLLLLPCIPLLNFERIESVPAEALYFFQEQSKLNQNYSILSSNPELITYLPQKVTLLGGLTYASPTYEFNRDKYQYIFLNTCDFPCSPEDQSCLEQKNNFLRQIAAENKELFRKEIKKCTALIYKK